MSYISPEQKARRDMVCALREKNPAMTPEEMYTKLREAKLYSPKTIKCDIITAINKVLKTIMIEVPLASREVTATGLYLMRWNGRTGLVRVIGQPKTGWKLLKPNDKTVEALFPDLPEDGNIPVGALLSEPLALKAI